MGSKEQFDEWFVKYYDEFLSWASYVLRDRPDLDSVALVNEVYIGLKTPEFEDEESFRKAVYHRIGKYWWIFKTKGVDIQFVSSYIDYDYLHFEEYHKERQKIVDEIVYTLEKPYNQILCLTFAGYSAKEVAKKINYAKKTVLVYKRRIKDEMLTNSKVRTEKRVEETKV